MITVLGEALIDVITHPDGTVTEVIGGAELNTARTIARLGVPVVFVGGISSDERGQRITAALVDDGVRLAFPEPVKARTTTAVAKIDADGNATYTFDIDDTSITRVTAAQVVNVIDPASRILHTGGIGMTVPSLADAIAAVVHASPPERLVMIDPNARPALTESFTDVLMQLDALLVRADIVKVSAEDLHHIYPDVAPRYAARSMSDEHGVAVLLTHGAGDVLVSNAQGERVVPVPRVEIVDTVGAGDAFSGGFAAWWDTNELTRADAQDLATLAAATAAGVVVAGLTCGRSGAQPPYRGELPNGWAS